MDIVGQRTVVVGHSADHNVQGLVRLQPWKAVIFWLFFIVVDSLVVRFRTKSPLDASVAGMGRWVHGVAPRWYLVHFRT